MKLSFWCYIVSYGEVNFEYFNCVLFLFCSGECDVEVVFGSNFLLNCDVDLEFFILEIMVMM